MGEQVLVIVALVVAFAAAVVGGSYVFAVTAETDPDQHQPTSRSSLH
jgi:hypothetical protein